MNPHMYPHNWGRSPTSDHSVQCSEFQTRLLFNVVDQSSGFQFAGCSKQQVISKSGLLCSSIGKKCISNLINSNNLYNLIAYYILYFPSYYRRRVNNRSRNARKQIMNNDFQQLLRNLSLFSHYVNISYSVFDILTKH